MSYEDGAESALLDIMHNCNDRSSLSDELRAFVTDWPTEYHTSPARPNALRALDLPADARVLEIGAGCGAITRYLAETCRWVDALEPMTPRAAVAAERTRECDNVAVIVGVLDDLRDAEPYDVIVINGVLEYVGGCSDIDRDEKLAFLACARTLLAPGGLVLCAIENRVGAKYVVGAPEDHTGVAWDGIEGYPGGGPARTFTRSELESLFNDAGFTSSQILHCFPDYKLARAVLSDRLLEHPTASSLAWRLPVFPSPDHGPVRPRGLREDSFWRSTVEDGTARHFANSFLMLATNDANALDQAAPPQRLASVFNTDRRSTFATRMDVIDHDDHSVILERRLLRSPEDEFCEIDGIRLDAIREPFVSDAPDMVTALANGTAEIRRTLMTAWRDLVLDDRAEDGWRSFDLVPTNLLVHNDGTLQAIDQEWSARDITADEVIERGLLLTAFRLAWTSPPSRWSGTRVADIVHELASFVGIDPDDAWFDRVVEHEARRHPIVFGERAVAADVRLELLAMLDAELESLPPGLREHQHRLYFAETSRSLSDERDEIRKRLQETSAALHDEKEHVERLHEHITRADAYIAWIESTRWWRLRARMIGLISGVLRQRMSSGAER